MILTNSIKYFILMASLLLVMFADYDSAFAQTMCPIKTLSVKKVQGQILFGEGKNINPLPYTKIELSRLGDPDVLITTIETDDKGFFKVNNILKGKYRLAVHFIVNGRGVAPKYDVILKVKESNASQSKKSIYVTLAVDCGDNIVKLVNNKQ